MSTSSSQALQIVPDRNSHISPTIPPSATLPFDWPPHGLQEECRKGLCPHEILPPSSEGYTTRFVSQDDLLRYMAEKGFSATFCRRPTGLGVLPHLVQGDFPTDAHTYAPPVPRDDRYKRIHITPTYAWSILPEADAVAALADCLAYKVYPDNPRSFASMGFKDIPRPSATDDHDGISFAEMFEAHKDNYMFLHALLVREPQEFLDIARSVFERSDMDNVQFWDCACLIERMSAGYSKGERRDLVDAWDRLVEAGLCDTLKPLLLRHLPILPVMSAFIQIAQSLMKSYGAAKKELRPLSPLVEPFLNEFWLQMGGHLRTIQGDAKSYPLVYHSMGNVYAITLRGKLVGMTMQFLVLSIDPQIGVRVSSQAYRMICRIGLLSWLHPNPDPLADADDVYHNVTVFSNHLLSFFTAFKKASGLTQRDLDAFVKEDVIGEYGAETFISRFTRALELRDAIHTDSQFDNLNGSLQNVGRILVHPDFRRYYASSGFIRAVCDLLDNERMQQYNDQIRWGVHRSVLGLLDAILEKSSIGQAAKPLLRRGIFPILAQSVILYAKAGQTDDHLLDNVVQPFKIMAGGARARGSERDRELFNAIKQSVKPDWWPTLHSLHELMSLGIDTALRCHQMIKVWMDLGDALGLEKTKEKAAYERERKRGAQLCAWKECEFHKVMPATPTRTCAGCGEVRYCSRACQQTDWTKGGHKRQCKRIKSEAHVPRTHV
ncbi:hypothetical protein PENSPDRAFT_749611 [Peniophora sp. CONT]|nr:hypothetical protein PENSPDRAFT_749611 [Peniophora sp. CONT]